jgi:hypothetical protein
LGLPVLLRKQLQADLFSVAQEEFKQITALDAAPTKTGLLLDSVADEILVGALLMPMAQTNLRAHVRHFISQSDASETGGSASEAKRFALRLNREGGELAQDAALNELDFNSEFPGHKYACSICGSLADQIRCPRLCQAVTQHAASVQLLLGPVPIKHHVPQLKHIARVAVYAKTKGLS